MVQSHDNNRLNILLCDFQLWTKTLKNHIHVHHIISRNLSHHELTQDKFDCRLVYRIAVAQRLQPCLHLIYRMNMTIKNMLLQWLCHLTYRRLPSHLGKSSKLVCTRFGVSYLDIVDWWRYKWYGELKNIFYS